MKNNFDQWINSLQNEIKSRQQQRIKLMEAIQGLQKQLNNVIGRNRGLGQEKQKLLASLRRMQQHLKTQENQLQDNIRAISNYKMLNKSAYDTNADLKTQIARVNGLLTTSVKNDDMKANLINKMIDDRQTRETYNIEVIDKLQKALSVYKNQILELSRVVGENTQKINQQDVQLIYSTQQRDRLNNEVITYKQISSKKQEHLRILFKNIQQGEKIQQNVKKLINQTEQKNQNLLNANKNLDTLAKKYEIQKIEKEKNIKIADKQIADLQITLKERDDQIEKLVQRLAKQRGSNLGSSSQLRNKIKDLYQSIQQLESNIKVANTTNKKLTEDLDNQIKKAQHNEKTLRAQIEAISIKVKQTVSYSSKKTQELSFENRQLTKKCDYLNQKMTSDKQTFSNQSLLTDKKLQIFDNYAKNSAFFKKIIDQIKQSLIQKQTQIKALQQANSFLRQQTLKYIQMQTQIRKQYNFLKSEMLQVSKSKLTKNYNSLRIVNNVDKNCSSRVTYSKIKANRDRSSSKKTED